MELESTPSDADTLFKINPSGAFLSDFRKRIEGELLEAARPYANHLIPHAIRYTVILSEMKNRLRNGDRGLFTRHELMHATSALARILKEMGIATDHFPSGILSADLVCVTRRWIVSEMADADARQFYQC